MLIPVDYAQVNFIHSGVGAPHGAQWTLGLQVADFVGSATELATQVGIDWQSAGMDDAMSASVTLDSILVKLGPNATGASALVPVGVAGSQPASGSPAVSLLVQKLTGFGGRQGRGRLYIPGVSESLIDPSGVIAGGLVSTAQAAFDDFFDKLTADDLVPVLLHAETSPVSTPYHMDGFSVAAIAATQRRRIRP